MAQLRFEPGLISLMTKAMRVCLLRRANTQPTRLRSLQRGLLGLEHLRSRLASKVGLRLLHPGCDCNVKVRREV